MSEECRVALLSGQKDHSALTTGRDEIKLDSSVICTYRKGRTL